MAMDVACRLAAERGASILAVAVIEVQSLLPLDAHLVEQEEDARRLLERVAATGDSFGVKVATHVVRGRDAGLAILDEVASSAPELVVLGAARKRLRSTGDIAFGDTVRHVLTGAPCRVLVVSTSPEAEPATAEAVADGRPARAA